MDLDDAALARFIQQVFGLHTDTGAVRSYLGGREELPSVDVERFSKMPSVQEKTKAFLAWMHTHWEIAARQSPDLNPAIYADTRSISQTGPASLQLPNGRVGVVYETAPLTDGSALVSIELPDDCGLAYDATTATIRGTPLRPGEFKCQAQWSDSHGRLLTGNCSLLINPDPRTLWQKIEPDPMLPYQKASEARADVPASGFRIAAASRRGRSHEHVGAFREDDFSIRCDTVSGWTIIAVADGAGSAKNSREGSRIAVERFSEEIQTHLSGATGAEIQTWVNEWEGAAEMRKQVGEKFHQLFLAAGNSAVSAIEAAATSDNLPIREYSTTLLAAAVRRDGEHTFVASFWIGDGAIAAYLSPGSVRLMGTPDSGEYAGQTKFLDRSALMDHTFAKRVSIGRFRQLHSLLLMTDGVSDPRFETDVGLSETARWDALVVDLAPCLSSEHPDTALLEWMEFFTPGHHDDRTVAVLW